MRGLRRILIVDDDPALRHSLAEQLEQHGEFAVIECDTAAAGLAVVGRERFDAILLDVGLPDMNGRELCRRMRRASVSTPIVMLTAADSEADTVMGLDAGANDHVTKPFRPSVLLARLRAHLRQNEHSDDAGLTIGPYTLQPGANLMVAGSGRKKVRLTAKGTATLKYRHRSGDRRCRGSRPIRRPPAGAAGHNRPAPPAARGRRPAGSDRGAPPTRRRPAARERASRAAGAMDRIAPAPQCRSRRGCR